MKNSKLRKALTLLACAVMLVCLSVGATLAYLTSTDTVTNTFSVGEVNITLDEADVYEVGENHTKEENQGKAIPGAERVDQNKYKVYPAGEYDKDPTVHIEKGSEKCYIGVTVKLNVANVEKLLGVIGYPKGDDPQYLGFDTIITGGLLFGDGVNIPYVGNGVWENADYKLIQTAKTGEFYIIFKQVQDATSQQVDLCLFEKIEIPELWGNTEIEALGGLQMDIKAYAVQKDGFDSAEEALYAAFEKEFAVLAPATTNE